MQIKYSEYRPTLYGKIGDYTLDYEFEGEVITATYKDDEQTITDTFDFSQLQEDEKLVDVNTNIPVKVIQKAERVDGEMKVVLMKPYGTDIAQEVMQKGEEGFPFSRDWQAGGGMMPELITEKMAELITDKLPTLEEMKEQKINQVKKKAHSLLSKTDWYVVRQQETGKVIPQDVLDERQSLRNQSEILEQEIEELQTKEEVKNYKIDYEV